MNKATIRIDKDSIFEQIAKKTSYIGSKMKDEDAYDNIFTTDEDQEFFEEHFDLAHAECVEMLYPYTKKDITENEEVQDGENMEDSEMPSVSYDIVLAVPKEMSQTTISLVERQINEYIVSRLIAEWMMVCNIDSHSYWLERYTSIRKQINRTLLSRMKPLRRTSRPF